MQKSNESLEEFLKETFPPEFLEQIELDYLLAEIAGQAYGLKKKSGLSYKELAKSLWLHINSEVHPWKAMKNNCMKWSKNKT
jgi:hypothetical protein